MAYAHPGKFEASIYYFVFVLTDCINYLINEPSEWIEHFFPLGCLNSIYKKVFV